ncbi:hypothetical protein FHQ18_09450 [Deferribacter autotrophicus]|uniref:Uncharacterized protein n=1 Tax=Deferribacter autotrophicus TaxID=500465 RepID=A0A5A8F700_9BACT|nr:hypothetical protein [Deferribacter autotrophicus]KAA0257557.1 hypothetical protein FHQ18_09450 [Deferribacter autotrophicus]
METKKVKVKYIKTKDFTQKFVNGAYGGLNLNGLVTLKFYYEDLTLPESVELDVDEKTGLVEESKINKQEFDGERRVEIELIMTPDKAREIAQFILDVVEGKIFKDKE